MSLSTLVSHPSTRSYVLKLHRDAAPQAGRLRGRIENISTGRCFEFGSTEELLECLTRDLSALASTDAAEQAARG